MKAPWTRSNREEVIAILWTLLYYTSAGQAADLTRNLFLFMALLSLIFTFYYAIEDNK